MGTRLGQALLVIGVVLTWLVPVAGVGLLLAGALAMAIASEKAMGGRDALEPAVAVAAPPRLDDSA